MVRLLVVLATFILGCTEPGQSAAPIGDGSPVDWTVTAAPRPMPAAPPVLTPRTTLPPVTGEQLRAFAKDGTIPPGWDDSAGAREALELLWMSYQFPAAGCVMPAPGEPVPDCMRADQP